MSSSLVIAVLGAWAGACAAAAGLCAIASRSDRRAAADLARHVARHDGRRLHGV